jgi:hypothetical protein
MDAPEHEGEGGVTGPGGYPPLPLSQSSPKMGYTTNNERNERMKHISEMFQGGSIEEQITNLFNGINRARLNDLGVTDPDDWREASEQDGADNE